MSQAAILETRELSKSYHNGPVVVDVLKNINLKIFTGEIVVIMGTSGVGKSTLLNVIGTLDQPTNGKVLIGGEDVFKFKEKQLSKFRNEHIGFIFQFHHLLAEFNAQENVLIPRMIKGSDWKTDEEFARQLLVDVGLSHRLTHRPSQLSGGEQQRVAIARALMNRPRLILADEPTGDLDRKNSQSLFNLIRELNEKYQQTFVIVTHDETLARQAHRIIELEDGQVGTDTLREN